MISLKVFYLTKIYWPFVLNKVRLLGLLKKIHKIYNVKFKKHCSCAYSIKPDRVFVWCEKCKAYQKHGRWK